ncbi:MAG: dTDP-4-dehydrorhamnose 3,5-epimerase [Salibacteraceae bacterium]|jgi:dTDP-4-dehydrorhamnose 3,5-epimerase
MKFIETKLKGCFIIEPKVFGDDRGYFLESYNHQKLSAAIGYDVTFVQDNQSYSSYGVLRGLHLQTGKNAQAKLVRVLSGTVLDVAVDVRPNSETYGQHLSIELSEENKKQLFVPRGFAHGFLVLSETAEFFYKVDNDYAPKSESGLLFNDSQLGINWGIAESELTIAPKDLLQPLLIDFNP